MSKSKPEASGTIAVQLDAIQVDEKKNDRTVYAEIDELAASIAERGQQVPLIVHPGKTPGTYVLVAGYRRMRALRKIGAAAALISVMTTEPTRENVDMARLIENVSRKSLTPIELGDALAKILDRYPGISQVKLSTQTGVSQGYISRLLKVRSSAAPQIKEALAKGLITVDRAIQFASLPEDEQIRRWTEAPDENPRGAAAEGPRDKKTGRVPPSAIAIEKLYQRATVAHKAAVLRREIKVTAADAAVLTSGVQWLAIVTGRAAPKTLESIEDALADRDVEKQIKKHKKSK